MNRTQQKTWDERHRNAIIGAPEPSLIEMLPLMGSGLALDIAAGSGRNAIVLARAGFRVVAMDFSAVAMTALAERARSENLPITTIIADLDGVLPSRAESFDLIANISFLNRELVPDLKNALRPGGLLFFDTFLIDQAQSGHPRDPRFLLDHWELRELLADMELLRYREGLTVYSDDKQAWRATALARRPA